MLLDTHVVLWLLTDDPQLGVRSRAQIEEATAVHVSTGTLWEIAIKNDLGRLDVPDQLPDLIETSGLRWLPVSAGHAWAVRDTTGLPHRDPFDRLFATQARIEELPLLTADRALLGADVTGLVTVDARQ
ncbi:MAG: type II toxin-antitoxin system VapC family toxin [Nocardioides sp.]|nr:type II toxin-antitoxin system VapC family toxin [Nocardioides sp.]